MAITDGGFEDVVAQDHADGIIICEVLRETESLGDSPLPLLVGVVQPSQPELFSVSQQPKKVTRVISTRHDEDVVDPRMNELVNGKVDHGPVEYRQKVLVGDTGHGQETATQSSGEYNALHKTSER